MVDKIQSRWPTLMNQVSFDERYVNYKDRDANTVLARRLSACNLGFVYTKNFSAKTKRMLTSATRSICATSTGNNIDFGIFAAMLRNCDKVGVNSKSLTNLQPVGGAIFEEMFNFSQRNDFFIRPTIPFVGKVRAITQSLTPSMVIMPRVNDDRFGPSGIATFNAVLSGIMPVNEPERGLYLPTDLTYNIERITRSVMHKYTDETTNMPVFMAIGPYNEMLCGNNLGNKYLPRNTAFNASSVLQGRKVGDKIAYDQKLCCCFWIGTHNETEYSVLTELQKICMRNGRVSVIPDEMKEIAVIKIGVVPSNKSACASFDSKTLRIENFVFQPDHTWELTQYTDRRVFSAANVDTSDFKDVEGDVNSIFNYGYMEMAGTEDKILEEEEEETMDETPEDILRTSNLQFAQPIGNNKSSPMKREFTAMEEDKTETGDIFKLLSQQKPAKGAKSKSKKYKKTEEDLSAV